MDDAMKMTPDQLAKAVRGIEADNRRKFIEEGHNADLKKLFADDAALAKAAAWSKLSPEELVILRPVKALAETEAARRLDHEYEAFKEQIRSKYGI